MSWKHVRHEAHRHTCSGCGQTRICRALGRGCSYKRDRRLPCTKCNQAANKIYYAEQAKIACARCGHAKWAHEDVRFAPKCRMNLGAVGLFCECEAYVKKEA